MSAIRLIFRDAIAATDCGYCGVTAGVRCQDERRRPIGTLHIERLASWRERLPHLFRLKFETFNRYQKRGRYFEKVKP